MSLLYGNSQSVADVAHESLIGWLWPTVSIRAASKLRTSPPATGSVNQGLLCAVTASARAGALRFLPVFDRRPRQRSDAGDAAGREAGGEAAALAGSAGNLELSVVAVERMLDDGQPEPGAA